jgi:hypothetical protein
VALMAEPGAGGVGARQPLAGIFVASERGAVGKIGPEQTDVAQFMVGHLPEQSERSPRRSNSRRPPKRALDEVRNTDARTRGGGNVEHDKLHRLAVIRRSLSPRDSASTAKTFLMGQTCQFAIDRSNECLYGNP